MDESKDDIDRYLQGKMSPEELHRMEKRALNDPFLSDALEGAESVPASSFREDMKELRGKIGRKQTSWFVPVRIAAGIVLLLGIGGLIYYYSHQDLPTLAENKSVPAPVLTDTTTKSHDSVPLLTLAQPSPTKASKKETSPIETEKSAALSQADNTGPAAKLDQLNAEEDEISARDKEAKGEEIIAEKSIQPELQTGAGARKEAENKIARSLTTGHATIKGTVTSSEDGSPIPGVNVTVKGTQTGTVTDIHGMYSLPVTQHQQSLVYSFVGMQTKEVNRQGEAVIDVKLSEDASQLSEVVVAGKPADDTSLREPVVRLASPVGGLKAYNQYLEENLKYPRQALDKKIKGKVTVRFTVTTEGLPVEFNVEKGLGYGCEEEVIRLVKEGPKWIPSTEDDVPVESEVKVKMKFDPAKVIR